MKNLALNLFVYIALAWSLQSAPAPLTPVAKSVTLDMAGNVIRPTNFWYINRSAIFTAISNLVNNAGGSAVAVGTNGITIATNVVEGATVYTVSLSYLAVKSLGGRATNLTTEGAFTADNGNFFWNKNSQDFHMWLATDGQTIGDTAYQVIVGGRGLWTAGLRVGGNQTNSGWTHLNNLFASNITANSYGNLPISSYNTAGIVAAGINNPNKVWKTDEDGIPGWQTDATADAGSGVDAVMATNISIFISSGFGTDSTNFALALAAGLTNLANARALASTNYTLAIGAASTNLSYGLGANATNFARNVGVDATNNTIIKVNAMGGSLTNHATAFALGVGAASTNLSTAVSNGAIAYAISVGLASTNLSTAVSNGVVAYANVMSNSLYALFPKIAQGSNTVIVTNVSGGLVTYTVHSTASGTGNPVTNFTTLYVGEIVLTNTLEVAVGGTGLTNILKGAVLAGDGTNALQPVSLGAGLTLNTNGVWTVSADAVAPNWNNATYTGNTNVLLSLTDGSYWRVNLTNNAYFRFTNVSGGIQGYIWMIQDMQTNTVHDSFAFNPINVVTNSSGAGLEVYTNSQAQTLFQFITYDTNVFIWRVDESGAAAPGGGITSVAPTNPIIASISGNQLLLGMAEADGEQPGYVSVAKYNEWDGKLDATNGSATGLTVSNPTNTGKATFGRNTVIGGVSNIVSIVNGMAIGSGMSLGTVANWVKKPDTRRSSLWYAEPSILYETEAKVIPTNGSVFKMWYYAWSGTNGGVAYGESLDGLSWTTTGVVLSNYARGWVFKEGATYYYTGTRMLAPTNYDIFSSTTGTNWTLMVSNIVSIGAAGQWDSGGFGNISILKSGSIYYAIYEARAAGARWNLGLATSTDLTNWVKYGSNPLLASWVGGVGGPSLVSDGAGGAYMWVHAVALPQILLPSDLYLTHSTNFTNWTVLNGGRPVIWRTVEPSNNDNINGAQIADPMAIEVGGKTYVFYVATGDQQGVYVGGGENGGGYVSIFPTTSSGISAWVTNSATWVWGDLIVAGDVSSNSPTLRVTRSNVVMRGGIDVSAATLGGNVTIGSNLVITTGKVILTNEREVSWIDSGGTARREMLLSAANAFYVGPVDAGWGGNTAISGGGDVSFRVNGVSGAFTEAMRIKAGGSVGINTNNPQAKIHNAGDTLLEGDVTMRSNLVVNGGVTVSNLTNNGWMALGTNGTYQATIGTNTVITNVVSGGWVVFTPDGRMGIGKIPSSIYGIDSTGSINTSGDIRASLGLVMAGAFTTPGAGRIGTTTDGIWYIRNNAGNNFGRWTFGTNDLTGTNFAAFSITNKPSGGTPDIAFTGQSGATKANIWAKDVNASGVFRGDGSGLTNQTNYAVGASDGSITVTTNVNGKQVTYLLGANVSAGTTTAAEFTVTNKYRLLWHTNSTYAQNTNVYIDLSQGNNWFIPLTNNTHVTITNALDGQRGHILLVQDEQVTVVHDVFTWNLANLITNSAMPLTVYTNAKAISAFEYIVHGTNVFIRPLDMASVPYVTSYVAGAISAAFASTNVLGSSYRFQTIVPTEAPTNVVVVMNGGAFQTIVATNNIFIQNVTNGPGSVTLRIRPNGANRTITWSTNFCTITNSLTTISGPNFVMNLTNGPRVAVLTLTAENNNQTNVVISGVITR
jgi:hypothetical protein